jgi:predicted protein tyrosine phosphatase
MKETRKVWLGLSFNEIFHTEPMNLNLHKAGAGSTKIANMVDGGWQIVDTESAIKYGEAVTIYTLERDVTPPTLADRLRNAANMTKPTEVVANVVALADEVADLEQKVASMEYYLNRIQRECSEESQNAHNNGVVAIFDRCERLAACGLHGVAPDADPAKLEATLQRLRAKQPTHRVIPQVNDGTPA